MISTDLWVLLTQTRITLEAIGDRLSEAIGYLPPHTDTGPVGNLVHESEQLLRTMQLVIREVDDAHGKRTQRPISKRTEAALSVERSAERE